jgi:hypothetical protein
MSLRFVFGVCSLTLLMTIGVLTPVGQSCAPAPRSGQPVVNADQTVILIWDAASKTQHFIRKATFTSAADDFGFLVPTPSQPELAEAGNDAFPYLQKLTEPEKLRKPEPWRGVSIGCSTMPPAGRGLSAPPVRVLEEKLVAGFNAQVLEADSPTALLEWLNGHGYQFSPNLAAWARPYIDGGWKFTALKVAKSDEASKTVSASSLRLSFRTERPLFPYREPDPSQDAAALGQKSRLLRIYFLAECRYEGTLTPEQLWTGRVAWAGKVQPTDRMKVLELLGLPASTGPAAWWLTEFEDYWPYRPAPADVYFAPSADQTARRREPIVEYYPSIWPVDVAVLGVAGLMFVAPFLSRLRRGRKR